MPRPAKPTRLHLRGDEKVWLILDRGRQIRTGCPEGDIAGAEKALSAYIATQGQCGVTPALLTDVGHVLAFYLDARQGEVADHERLVHCAVALSSFWAAKPVSAVTRAECKAYAAHRRLMRACDSTIRRELSMLKSALTFCDEEQRLDSAYVVWLPRKSPVRDRSLTRSELALLMWHAAPHLRRFILLSRYTGRRHRSVLSLTWAPMRGHGHIDLERERIRFLPLGEAESTKRRGSVPIPRPLLPHLKRWSRLDAKAGCSHVINFRGRPVKSIRTAWAATLDRSGIEGVVPHTLKHTAVTTYFELGGDLADGVDFFATTAETLMAIYRKSSPIFARRGADVMARRNGGK